MPYLTALESKAMSRVVDHTAEAFGIERHRIWNPRRWKNTVRARQAAQWFAVQCLGLSSTGVAQFFVCDHSTVLHSRRKVEERMEIDDEYRRKVDVLIALGSNDPVIAKARRELAAR